MRENILHITLISIPTINFIITFFLFTKVAPSTPNDVTQNWGIKISTQIAHPSLLPVPVLLSVCHCSRRNLPPLDDYSEDHNYQQQNLMISVSTVTVVASSDEL